MSWDVSFTIHCTCDRCGASEDYEVDEPMDDDEVERYLYKEDWMERDGETLCMECYNDTKGVDEFTDKCLSCWHRCNQHCPQYRMSCERVYEEYYSFKDDATCEHFIPIGGNKNGPPKYKPTDASLEKFWGTEEQVGDEE